MSTPSSAPPSAAEQLLRLSIRDAEWRESITGDLREEFSEQARRRGAAAASRWYWGQALRLAIRFTASRVIPAAAPGRRPLVLDIEGTGADSAGWLREFRYAWRAVRRRPSLSGTIVVTLALALAANATIFNLADALFLRPFRFAGVERLAIVMSDRADDPLADRSSVSAADLREWMRDSTTLRGFAAAEYWDPNLSENGEPEQVPGFRVSPAFFRTLGVAPILGRAFLDEEGTPGNERRVLVSHRLWVRRFGGRPAIVGTPLRLNGEPYEVIGVMPPGFTLPFGSEVWAPIALTDEAWADRRRGHLYALARLADDKTLEDASVEMRSLVDRQRRAYPETNAKRDVSVVTFTRGFSDEGAGPFLALWQGAALMLLLIACANIANLLLARGTERQQEFAVRLALGAARGRLAGQVLIEGLWLSAGAFALAIPLTMMGISATRRGLPANIVRYVPGYEFLKVDGTVLATTAALGALATIAFALLPALYASRAGLADSLRQGGRGVTSGGGRQRLRTGLAATQVALTVVLIAASMLILGGVDTAVNGSLGFDKRQLMTAELTLPDRPYADEWRRLQFVTKVLDRLATMPAIESVAAVSALPYGGGSTSRPFYPEGVQVTPADVRRVDYERATPGYLATIGVPLVEGRALHEADTAGTRRVALVSRGLAERYWSGRNAIGQRFRIAPDAPWIEVVGVVGDVTQDWFGNQRRPTVYCPVAQDAPYSLNFVARTVGSPLDVAGEIRRAVSAADAEQPILFMRTMEQVIKDKVGGIAYLARALAVMTGIALALALMGVYGLVAFITARKTQEIGVRLALGATRWQIIRFNMVGTAAITIVGLVAGGAMATGIAQLMGSILYGLVLPRTAPVALAVVALGAVALLAAYLPARRAADLDPTIALRAD